MNQFYQYYINEKYHNLVEEKELTTSPVETLTGSTTLVNNQEVTAPEKEEPSVTLTSTTETTTPQVNYVQPTSEPITSEDNLDQPITTSGDSSTTSDSGTTINIFNPTGTTTGTTTAKDISVDTLTGDVDTGKNVSPVGGGGGFMGGGEEKSSAPLVKPKTWIPLLVIAAGIGVIILKPIK